jgi:aminoglycoside 6'-N-acetyltransferase I
MLIRQIIPQDHQEWLRMRRRLWPELSLDVHLTEMEALASDATSKVFVAARPGGSLGGFLEAAQRNYAEGCDSSPVGYIEGWYVDSDLRRQGLGGQLVRAAEAWARALGLVEMASDCLLDNEVSLVAHISSGYQEVERLIHFKKRL